MMRLLIAYFRSDNGAARRLKLSMSYRKPRHWVKGEALVRHGLRIQQCDSRAYEPTNLRIWTAERQSKPAILC